MQVLPSDLVVPPLPYAAALAVGAAVVLAALVRLRPPVTGRTVPAATPWMVVGGGLHGLEQYGLVPGVVVPLVTAPAVYVTTTVAAGAVWAAAASPAGRSTDATPGEQSAGDRDGHRAEGRTTDGESADGRSTDRPTGTLGLVGGVALAALVAFAYADALGRVGAVTLAWPLVGVVGAAVVGGPVYYLLVTYRPTATEQAGVGGAVAVFAHALDGVSTAIGVDLLGTGERSPIPRAIMEFAGTLPTAPYLGSGWLFVVAKLAVAAALVVLLADYVEDDPVEGNLLLMLVAAVGLGPAANNLTLFLLAGG